MKIAQIAPLYEAVPPARYGGTERIAAYLSDALVEHGHEVTLFACAGAETKAEVVSCRDQPLRLDPALKSDLAAHIMLLDRVLEHADEFDMLHFHTDLLHFPMFESLAGKTVTTLHGRLDMKDIGACYARYPQFPLVSISNDQRRAMPDAGWVRTVYHGLPADLLHPAPEPSSDYLAFLGRISPEKGPETAIAIAKEAGLPLRIAAKVDPADADYFETVIKPLLDHPLIDFVGEIGDAEKSEFLGNACALLFPIAWPEPFGLVMIEAMACGTPVIAFRHGSVPEVIDEGLTGLIVDNAEDAVNAVRLSSGLDRDDIRRQFVTRFSAATMARNYTNLYEQLLDRRPSRRRASLQLVPAAG